MAEETLRLTEAEIRALAYPQEDWETRQDILDVLAAKQIDRLMTWVTRVGRRFPGSDAERIGRELVSVMFAQFVQARLASFCEPVFAAWLCRAERELELGHEVEVDQSSKTLPLMLLPVLASIARAEAIECTATIPGDHWIALPRSNLSIRSRMGDIGGPLWVSQCEARLYVGDSVGFSCGLDPANGSILRPLVGHQVALRTRPVLPSGQGLFELSEMPEVLGGCPVEDWGNAAVEQRVETLVCEALTLLEENWPEGMSDLKAFAPALVLVTRTDGAMGSVCSVRLPRVIGISFAATNPVEAAELLLHEMSHVKIDVAQSICPLIHDTGMRAYRHPWRQDLRTITGVLYAAHAFLTTLAMKRRAL